MRRFCERRKKNDEGKPLGQAGISVLRVAMSHQQDLAHSQTNRYTSLQHPNILDQVSYVLICFGVIFLDSDIFVSQYMRTA